jgi:Rod binding domain-containing protein
MSFELSSLSPMSSLTPTAPLDLSGKDPSDPTHIKQVSKAMESLFTRQIMSEMGKGVDGTDDSKEGGPYQDFIQQAMTQGVTQGGGFGLAKVIEKYLTQRDQTKPAHMDLEIKNTSYHVNRTE